MAERERESQVGKYETSQTVLILSAVTKYRHAVPDLKFLSAGDLATWSWNWSISVSWSGSYYYITGRSVSTRKVTGRRRVLATRPPTPRRERCERWGLLPRARKDLQKPPWSRLSRYWDQRQRQWEIQRSIPPLLGEIHYQRGAPLSVLLLHRGPGPGLRPQYPLHRPQHGLRGQEGHQLPVKRSQGEVGGFPRP